MQQIRVPTRSKEQIMLLFSHTHQVSFDSACKREHPLVGEALEEPHSSPYDSWHALVVLSPKKREVFWVSFSPNRTSLASLYCAYWEWWGKFSIVIKIVGSGNRQNWLESLSQVETKPALSPLGLYLFSPCYGTCQIHFVPRSLYPLCSLPRQLFLESSSPQNLNMVGPLTFWRIFLTTPCQVEGLLPMRASHCSMLYSLQAYFTLFMCVCSPQSKRELFYHIVHVYSPDRECSPVRYYNTGEEIMAAGTWSCLFRAM